MSGAGDASAVEAGPAATHGWRIPLSDLRLPAEAIEAAREVLASGWLSSGPRVRAFEQELAEFVDAAHAVSCSSGTAALELAYRLLEIGPGDEVVMPSLTFVAGANAARLRGAEPVFCDVVGEDDLTVDPDSLARAITPRTRAVVLMHYGGYPCRPEALEVARERGVAVIEDAAHALGAEGVPGRCGSWGDVACFSFFANKNLALGEGGALTTSDPDLAGRALRLRSHGMTSATWERHTGAATSYDVRSPGHNFRFDEARAAMGSVLLHGLAGVNERRGALVARYRERLSARGDLTMPFGARPADERSAHHLAVALLPSGADREAVSGRLREAGVQTSVHYPPTHAFTAYRGAPADVERTESLAGRVLTLPLYPHLDPGGVDLVCDEVERALDG